MKLSRKVEYACLAVIELASAPPSGGLRPVHHIAEAHGIPKQYLARILLGLKRAGIVQCARGALGGYRLARPADRISIAQIIVAIDGHRELSLRGKSTAAQSLGQLLVKAQEAEHTVLAATSIAELTSPRVNYDCAL